MLAQTRLKLKNAESSIAFMQEQHAKTLEGLHHEIQKLQQKNARLTFELAMKGPSTKSSVSSSCTCCRELEEELTLCKAEILGLRSSLSTHKESIKFLEHQTGELESRNDKAAASNDEKISGMAVELESKSDTIALLTQQLYQSKVRLQQALEVNSRLHEHMNRITGELSSHQYSSHSTSTPGIVRRSRKPRRAASSPSPHDVSSLSLVEDRASMQQQPLPISPRPPSTSPSTSSVKRASNPIRRESSSPGSKKDSQYQYARVCRSQQVSRHSDRALDPIRSHRQTAIPREISDILQIQTQELLDEGTTVNIKPLPPVLPPIGANCSTSSQILSSESLHLPLGGSDSPAFHTNRHRHIILAKAQGLGSAQSTVRVLQQQRAGLTEDVVSEEDGDVEPGSAATATKGSLLVRQSVNKKNQAWQELHQQGAD